MTQNITTDTGAKSPVTPSADSVAPLRLLKRCNDRLRQIETEYKVDDIRSGKEALKQIREMVHYFIRELMQFNIEEVKLWGVEGGLEYKDILRTALQYWEDDEELRIMEEGSSLYRQGQIDHPLYPVSFAMTKVLYTAYRFPNYVSIKKVPKDMLNVYLSYQLEGAPGVHAGDDVLYCQHYERVFQDIEDFVSDPDVPEQSKMIALGCFLSTGRSYMEHTEYNLKKFKMLRHSLLSRTIEKVYPKQLDWVPPPRNAEDKIKIGVVVRTIMTGTETMTMLVNISKLDRTKYHIVLLCFDLSNGYYHDIEYYRQLVESVDEIAYIGAGDVIDAVKAIRKKNIDLLWIQTALGIGDSTAMAHFLSFRLARAECLTGAFYSATSGNKYIKYYINIKQIFPVKTWEGEFSEQEINMSTVSLYVPGAFKAKDAPNKVHTRASLDIPSSAVVYFSGASCNRYSAICVNAWMEILKRVPNAYLVLCSMNPIASPDMVATIAWHAQLQNAFKNIGDFSDRVRVIKHVNGQAIALMHSWSDVHLSTFPFGGVTTLTDALRGGLAPVCKTGIFTRSNGDAAVLETYGMLDLVTKSVDEYIDRAVKLGNDPAFREEIRARVKQAYATRFPKLKDEVAISSAEVIDQIVEAEFGIATDHTDFKPAKAVAG